MTDVYWVGYVDPDTHRKTLTCGPYGHLAQAQDLAAKMRCPGLPFEVFVQRIEAMQYSPDGPVVRPRRISVPAFLIFLVIFLTLIVR